MARQARRRLTTDCSNHLPPLSRELTAVRFMDGREPTSPLSDERGETASAALCRNSRLGKAFKISGRAAEHRHDLNNTAVTRDQEPFDDRCAMRPARRFSAP